MKVNVGLLKEICEVAGAPGHEQRVREIVYRELENEEDEIKTDNLGSVYAIRKGKSNEKPAMVAAHMDEIGFIVKHLSLIHI